MKIFFGPAGIGSGLDGLRKISKAGLSAAEVAFTYSIYMNEKTAIAVGKFAKESGIKLSIHAPYWINLNSTEKKKVEQSKKRILKCCEIGHYLRASKIVFHPGFYGKSSREETYENIKSAINEMQNIIKEKKWRISLAPETTGKLNVFGSLDEIGRLMHETKCSFCIDFAHLKARACGKTDYKDILKEAKRSLKNVEKIHAHFSGVEWTSKGEKRHILTSETEIKKLSRAILENKWIKEITIINESPDPLGDSVKMKEVLKS